MKVSSDNMYTSGEYLKNNPGWNEEDAPWKAAIIYGLIKRNNVPIQSVIEVGCGSGGILKHLSLTDGGILSLKGYDISPQAIALAKPKQSEHLAFYNEDFLKSSVNKTDVLLVIDVLEHVDDYYDFLRKLKPRSSYFVFHVPLDLCCRTLIKPHVLLQQREAVGHIHYFSKEMVTWFLKDTGYETIDWEYTRPVADIEPANSFKQYLKKRLRNVSYNMVKDLSAKLWGGYSMMILAK